MASRKTANNSDLRRDAVQGVDKTHNVWEQVQNHKTVTRIFGICHQEIGRMVTDSNTPRVQNNDGNLYEQMQQRLKGQTGQALFNLNKTMRNLGAPLNDSNGYINAHKRFREGRNSFFSPQEARPAGIEGLNPHNRVGSIDIATAKGKKPVFPFDLPPIGNRTQII